MENNELIRLYKGDCIHIIRKDHPQQIGLVVGPAFVIVVKEEAAAVTTASIARDEGYWRNVRQGEIGQKTIVQDEH